MGTSFFIIGILFLHVGTRFYYPRRETKREQDLAKKWTYLAGKKELWTPVVWKKMTFMFYLFCCAAFWTQLIEFAFWSNFGQVQYTAIVLAYIIGLFVDEFLKYVIQDALICAPLSTFGEFMQSAMTFGGESTCFSSVCLFVCLCICLSTYLSFYLSISQRFIWL
jgi:hypothetical protein